MLRGITLTKLQETRNLKKKKINMQSQTVCEIYLTFIFIFANVGLFRFLSKPSPKAEPVSHSKAQLAKKGEWKIIFLLRSWCRASLMYSFKYNQQDATLYSIIYCCQCSTCFGRFFRPSSGAQELYTQHRVYAKLSCCYR